METQQFLKEIEALLVPSEYKQTLKKNVPDGCVFLKKGLYVFLAMPFDRVPGHDFSSSLARSIVRSVTFTFPMIAEKGLFLMYYGPQSNWEKHTKNFTVDKTGLRPVILQSIHFVDPATGFNINSRTHWGPIQFGFCGGVIRRIEEFCRRAGQAR
jgi:hypothetical protein